MQFILFSRKNHIFGITQALYQVINYGLTHINLVKQMYSWIYVTITSEEYFQKYIDKKYLFVSRIH